MKTAEDLLAKGYSCSQTIMMMTMQRLGIEDEHLVRAMKGLSGGMGIQHACGIVTGAACAFSLADPQQGITTMFPAFFERFYNTYGDDVESIHCIELLHGDYENRKEVCPGMIAEAWQMVNEVLQEHGY
ncbi:MAG: C-GCAxxG-C-C family protein [Oscillospiraceae bacterium]|jgi:C_GCAxxG_C_C family probable redox protein